MTKQAFLAQLRNALSGLPQADIEERLAFYSEMIEDRIEEGLPEAEAVAAVGAIPEITAQIIADTPLVKLAKERMKPNRRLKTGEVVLLALGSPLWLSLCVAAIAVVFALYLSGWSVLVSLWAVFGSLAACFLGFLTSGLIFACTGNSLSGIAMIAAALVCAGISIFAFYGSKAATNGILRLTKKVAMWMKNCVVRKEGAQ